jgi:serine/threonine protein kinase
MVFSNQMSNVEKHERMAIMEAAISSSLSHPNIVQTYTYSMRSISDESTVLLDSNSFTEGAASAAAGDGRAAARTPTLHFSRSSGCEVQLVLEYCEHGSLRSLLDKGVFISHDPGGTNHLAVLEVAADIARGMLHLHTQNVVHSDLKVCSHYL